MRAIRKIDNATKVNTKEGYMSSATNPVANAASSAASSTGSSATSSTSGNSKSATKDKQNFLKLFTEELKNQDPTSPTDISTYYSTINQYYSLEQQTTMNSYLATIANDLANSSTGGSSGTAATASTTPTTTTSTTTSTTV